MLFKSRRRQLELVQLNSIYSEHTDLGGEGMSSYKEISVMGSFSITFSSIKALRRRSVNGPTVLRKFQ